MKKIISILFIATNTFAMTPENNTINSIVKPIWISRSATLFDKIRDIHRGFFAHSESVVGYKISEQFDIFRTAYDRRESALINLNGLSPRSCIELFRQIIDYNNRQHNMGVPIIFKLGCSQYRVICKPTISQPGNIILTINGSEAYHNWKQIFCLLKQEIEKSGENLLTTSRPLSDFHDRIVNECKILLYFEVARRLINGDRYENLPIAVFLPYLLEHFKYCEELFAPKNNASSLFAGEAREEVARNFVLELKNELWGNRWIGLGEIRDVLSALHYDEEDSDCAYVEY